MTFSHTSNKTRVKSRESLRICFHLFPAPIEGQLNESARRSVFGELMDRRYFSGRIKAYCGTELNHTVCDLSRGKAEVKSMTRRDSRGDNLLNSPPNILHRPYQPVMVI